MAAAVGSIGELWRYPVKSMRGEQLTAASLDARGLHGDRAYALVAPETGKVGSAKHPRLWGRLLTCRAEGSATAGDVRITLPDGHVVLASSDEADAALSAVLGHPVALRDEPPATPEIERYWPDVEGLDLRDTLTSGTIGRGAPPGTFFDYAPVHLLTTAALAWLRALCPDAVVAVQRFRPNLVIEPPMGAEGCVEDGWVGRTLRIGQHVRLRVLTPTPRCVVPTLPQGGDRTHDELPQQIEILRTIAAHHRPPIPLRGGAKQPSLGVYAVVEQGGAIQLGDEVRLLDGD
ncbi:MAG TPA: MOSC N-terminal beta barrel domain-containing protein [Ktedonobacterales bacterium]|nr:MOSC N-terminal beta barrel domain-containing protein [Ktedonobacterales bacterium]